MPFDDGKYMVVCDCKPGRTGKEEKCWYQRREMIVLRERVISDPSRDSSKATNAR